MSSPPAAQEPGRDLRGRPWPLGMAEAESARGASQPQGAAGLDLFLEVSILGERHRDKNRERDTHTHIYSHTHPWESAGDMGRPGSLWSAQIWAQNANC